MRMSRAWECPPHMPARRDRLRHHFDFPKELHFPKPCSFLPLFVGPSVLFPQDRLADVCWTILVLDAVRFAALEKTRHSLNLELPKSQAASNATPQKASVHRKTAVPCPLRRPALFRRDANRSEAHHLGALAPWPAASQAGRLHSAQWHASGGARHISDRSPLRAGTAVLRSLLETRRGWPSNPIRAAALAPTRSPALPPTVPASMGEIPPPCPSGS